MSDDHYTNVANTGNNKKFKVLALIAIGSACALGAYSMSSQASTQEAFLQADFDDQVDFDMVDFEDAELELRGGRFGNINKDSFKNIPIDKVNKYVARVWQRLEKKTNFPGKIDKAYAKKATKKVFKVLKKEDKYSDVLFEFAWLKFDIDKSASLNELEFTNLVDFLVEKYNAYQGNMGQAEASVQ